MYIFAGFSDDNWFLAQIQVRADSSPFIVIFEVVTARCDPSYDCTPWDEKSVFTNSIAIDDIVLRSRSCLALQGNVTLL